MARPSTSSAAAPPPVYQPGNREIYAPSVSSLPAYTRQPPPRPTTSRRELTEHVFELRTKYDKVWLTWKLMSYAREPDQLPTFLEGNNIRGSLTLNLEQPDAIQTISISLCGQVITGNRKEDIFTFLDLPIVLWSKDSKDISSSISPITPRLSSGKLFGKYTWDLNISIPKEVFISKHRNLSTSSGSGSGSGGTMGSYHLPQTFVERHTRSSVQYTLTCLVTRGTFRSDSKIKTLFIYVPAIQPSPPSTMRQLSYQENTPIPGPDMDPEGWKTFVPFTIRGRVFSTRDVELKSTLSLAKPLSYTRGSAIPCHLILDCVDSQALDLLATSRAITLKVRRSVEPSDARKYNSWGVMPEYGDEEVATAVWWASATGSQEDNATPTRRVLDGEIQLPKSLKPTSHLAHFIVNYNVVWLPFRAAAFTIIKTDFCFEQRVEIATVFPSGPRPRTYAPPEYSDTTNNQRNNSNSSRRRPASRPHTGGISPSLAALASPM